MKNTDLQPVLPTPIEQRPSRVPLVWSIGQPRRSIVERVFADADVRINGSRPWDIRVHRDRFFPRVLAGTDLGFGEWYMDGDFSCDRLDELATRIFRADIHRQGRWVDVVDALVARVLSRQTRARVRRQVAAHYDLGNDLFEAMLDTRHMAYTCAYWRSGAQTLEDAQDAKLDLICRKLTLEPGMRVLDIGCGWGGLARFAATRYGVSVTGVTLSREQARFGSERSTGLPIDIRVQDYRDVRGQFDRVVSVGCLEHIGHRNHRRFFETIRARLADGGHAVVHSIGVPYTLYRAGRFIDKYVFPLVNLPSMAQIGRSVDGLFVVDDVHNFGTDYDLTLMAWHERFERAWPQLEPRYGGLLDGRFKRMFDVYLLMTAGLFRARQAQVWQFVLTPPGTAQPACRHT